MPRRVTLNKARRSGAGGALGKAPLFAQEREETHWRPAPGPEDALLRADAERERAQRQADVSSERCQELEEELESARAQIETLEARIADLGEELVNAKVESETSRRPRSVAAHREGKRHATA
jgi:chromosome segregation ATPase